MKHLPLILACLLAAALAPSAGAAVKIADITRLDGQRANIIAGLGLVTGLKGTGDGGDFSPAINPLRAMLANFSDPVTARELANVQNVAVVSITVTIPPNGVHNGDRLDVYVSSLGAATSLRAGRLFITPLQLPIPIPAEKRGEILPLAYAQGLVTIEDPTTPTNGVVKGGAIMDLDLPMPVINRGRIRLIIDEPAASWTNASTIAKIINDAEGNGETLATVINQTTVDVTIPDNERQRPDSFIGRIQQLPVRMLPTEARVQVNEKTGTIIMTGDVEISPVVISHKGLTISTVNPAPTPSVRNPVVTDRQFVGLDTTAQGGAKLKDLVDALDMIKVPAEDRVTIVKELYKTGKLHAKLIME